tara:strand:- start:169 stop:936 length:768 start_codon:yes stop_codon:yes gene_type:complete
MENNLRQEEVQNEEVQTSTPEPFQEPNDMQMEEVGEQSDSGEEAKKFQSMYDKKSADFNRLNDEVQDLKKLEKLGNILKERPDVVEAMKQKLNGQNNVNEQPQQQAQPLDENSFDPWEAYYKPGSPSFEMRVGQEKALVNEAVSEQMRGIQETVAVNNLKGELSSKYGFKDPKQVEDFITFATKPREDVPLDVLVDVYRKHNGSQEPSPSIEATKRTQALPQSAGVLQGGEPKKASEMDDIWSKVMSASSRNNVL